MKHFSNNEFACKDGCGLNKAPSPILLQALEELRELCGNRPVTIISGWRCAANNARSGGAKNSQHLFGGAADLYVAGMPILAVYRAAVTVKAFSGFGLSKSWLHVDVKAGPRRWWRYDPRGRVVAW